MSRPIEAHPHAALGALPTARQAATRPIILPLLVSTLMIVGGVVLRAPTAAYTGLPDQSSFNNYIFEHVGAYSDITSLYFRDQLWRHPTPYFDYYVEYPVGMGWLIWLIGFVNSGVMPYFLATAAVLLVCGLATIWLGSYFERANLWLLALSPTLPLYVVLNWDVFGIMLTVAALLLFHRRRDGWASVLLAGAVWTKFFPIVLVPLVVFDRALRRRWRDATLIGGVFALMTVLINAPVALIYTEQAWQLRDSWLHFFRFNQSRGSEANFWTFFNAYQLTLQQINTFSALLLIVGIGLIMLLMWLNFQQSHLGGEDLLLLTALAAIGWFFFINKVYSPQYSLWLAVLLALVAAPPTLAVAFAAVDLMYFAASFIMLYLAVTNNTAVGWFFDQALFPAMTLREAVILAIVVYAGWQIVRPNRGESTPPGLSL